MVPVDGGRKSGHFVRVTRKQNHNTDIRYVLEGRSRSDVARALNVSPRTVQRWLTGESHPKAVYLEALRGFRSVAEPEPPFTFIDLFAGIGGLRRGFEQLNGRCVFTSEWDAKAAETYRANFPSDGLEVKGDITAIDPAAIPDHEILLAGFPCQPFSLAGVSKKRSLGRETGFLDKTQGTLFFNVVRILEAKAPKAFLLENVKNLRSHDGGRTYAVILGALRELGYQVYDKVINSQPWVPQKRERIFLVGFKANVAFSFDEMARPAAGPTLRSILHSPEEAPEPRFTRRFRGKTVVLERYTLSDHLWDYLQRYAEKHRAQGNGFGCSVFGPDAVARTLSARYHKDGSEILIEQKGKNPRRLTPRECARLMGFDRAGRPDHVIPDSLSDTQAYRQFGNSVVVPVVEELAKIIVPRVLHPDRYPAKPKLQYDLLESA